MAPISIVCLVAFLLIALADAIRYPHVKFGYMGHRGPSVWGILSPDYKACSRGKHQSPINIEEKEAIWYPHMEPLIRDYNSVNATLVDYGFNVVVQWESRTGGVLSIEGKNYTLVQLHWHSPSEHAINGVRYAAELHLVHRSDEGNLSVVSILYKLGKPDPLLVQIHGYISQLTKDVCAGHADAHIPLGVVNIRELKQHTRKYYRYVGSLTVPPCTEKVIWNILGKVREMSRQQLLSIRAPLAGSYRNNARPLQPLNGRHVQMYDEGHHRN